MSTLKVNTLEEATAGGATYFTAKAWVNFNGTGTVAIRADGNVSSITDEGTGQYKANFSTSFSDGNYSCPISTSIPVGRPTPWTGAYTTSSVALKSFRGDTNIYADCSVYAATVTR
jgi:hypothetical protein